MSRTLDDATRLAIVLSHPTQYYSPWFRWIRAHTPITFRVFYLWDFGVAQNRDPHFGTSFEWDVDLLSGYEYEFLPNAARRPGAEQFFGFDNPGLTRQINEWRANAVLLFGYKWSSHMKVIAWATCAGIPMLFRGDSHLLGRGTPSIHVRIALRMLYSRFAAFLCVGEANRQYFEEFKVPARKLFFAPHSVDAELYSRENGAHVERARELRLQLGIESGKKVVLFAGKLIAAKQPTELLVAFVALDRPNTVLVFVGDGPEKESLLAKAAASGRNNVHFLPFANQSEMPSRYLIADIFTLPSRGVYETWGLAVNEAMHMGIPCLVSNRVGCQRDLVIAGETGWVFDALNPGAMGQVLALALQEISSPERYVALQQAVAKKISSYTYARTTEGLIGALASLRQEQR